MTLAILIITFISGFGLGVALLLFVAGRFNRNAQHSPAVGEQDLSNLIERARQRFGQIANRESINEARKIANKALKELP